MGIRIVALVLLGTFACGCMSHTYGTKIDSQTVSRIEKGRTTRAEVESLLGPPANVFVLGDGRRMMSYNYFEMEGRAKPQSFIPFVGIFAGGGEGTQRQQTLQIYLSTQNIVEDYEFSDRTSETESSGFMGVSKTTAKPTPSAEQ